MTREKAVVFGIGKLYEVYKNQLFSDFDIVALIDNDFSKHGKVIDGLEVLPSDALDEIDYDIVCVTTNTENSYEIKKQLIKRGVKIDRIRFHEPAGIYPYRIPKDFFTTNLSNGQKERVFRENVERVIIEVNSRCNRRCWFCPNSIVDRHSDNIEMTDSVFCKVVKELGNVEYDRDVCLSYFNEPLLSEKIIDRVSELRKHLPKAFIYLFTNGDYLDKNKIHNLAEAGLNLMKVDIYTNEAPGEYSEIRVRDAVERKIDMLNINSNYNCIPPVISRANIGGMEIEFISQDFSKTACNRAESLPESLSIPKVQGHSKPCIKNFISFHISYNGNVYPCPNMHTEVTKHNQYCVGNVKDSSIFEIYLGDKLNKFRENNFFHRNQLPCRSCIWDFNSFIYNRFDKTFRDRPSIRY